MSAAGTPAGGDGTPVGDPAATGPETGDHLVEVRITAPDERTTERLARTLLEQQLAACVQAMGPIASLYSWQGEVHRDAEWLLLAKTVASAFPRLCEVVQEVHPYDVPEILAVPVSHALPPYGEWVMRHTREA